MKSNALYVSTGSERCYKLADDIANQNIALSVIFLVDEIVIVFLCVCARACVRAHVCHWS